LVAAAAAAVEVTLVILHAVVTVETGNKILA
jgi:hypothetical protein